MASPTGYSVLAVAAWEKSMMLRRNSGMAKSTGQVVNKSPTLPRITSLLPSKKVLPIQATPKMDTIATIPAVKTLPVTAFFTSAFPTSRMRAAILIMVISMAAFMLKGSPLKDGRREGKLPKITTSTTPSRNTSTARLAAGLFSAFSSLASSASGLRSPSRTLR